jgi:hypothetical protein
MRFEGNASGWSRPFIFELKNAYLVASTSNGTLHERPDGLPRIDVHVYFDAFGSATLKGWIRNGASRGAPRIRWLFRFLRIAWDEAVPDHIKGRALGYL